MNDNRLIEFTRQTIPDLIALYRFGSQAKEAMVGFRNVAVHEYTRLNLEVVHYHHHQAIRRFPYILVDHRKGVRLTRSGAGL